jgi:serralysin
MANYYGDDSDNTQSGGFVNYYGGDGSDALKGTAAANELYGGQGNDALAGGPVTLGGSGTPSDPYTYASSGPSGSDTLEGGSGNDGVYGLDGDDVISGGQGDDAGIIVGYSGYSFVGGLHGGDGLDTIYGGGGNDEVSGDEGNDALYGDEGNDVIVGGLGQDHMWGGGGADRFVFNDPGETGNSKGSADVIHDFSRAEGDQIDVSGMGINFDFIGKQKFHDDGDAELRFKKGYVYGDTDGDGQADFIIKMVGVSKMNDGDFVV